jgi:hypothetical protein
MSWLREGYNLGSAGGLFSFPMNNKTDEIIFGAKRAGVTWLYRFPGHAALDSARLNAKRLGSSLRQMLCGPYPKEPENNLRRFTHKDRESHGLKIQIIECDELTRRALERQAAYYGYSLEEYLLDGALCSLASDEEITFLDPATDEVVASYSDFGNYIGCKVDKRAQEPPPSHFGRIPIPRGAIVEACP